MDFDEFVEDLLEGNIYLKVDLTDSFKQLCDKLESIGFKHFGDESNDIKIGLYKNAIKYFTRGSWNAIGRCHYDGYTLCGKRDYGTKAISADNINITNKKPVNIDFDILIGD